MVWLGVDLDSVCRAGVEPILMRRANSEYVWERLAASGSVWERVEASGSVRVRLGPSGEGGSDSLRKTFTIERLIHFFEFCEGGYFWKPK